MREQPVEPPRQRPARSPSQVSTAGASSMRTIVTSTAIAVASPRPIIFTIESDSVTKPRKTAVMIAPAVPITLAVRPTACVTAPRASPVRRYSSRTRLSRKTL